MPEDQDDSSTTSAAEAPNDAGGNAKSAGLRIGVLWFSVGMVTGIGGILTCGYARWPASISGLVRDALMVFWVMALILVYQFVGASILLWARERMRDGESSSSAYAESRSLARTKLAMDVAASVALVLLAAAAILSVLGIHK